MKVLNLLLLLYYLLFVTLPNVNAQIQFGNTAGDLKADTLKKTVLDNAQYRVYYTLEFVKNPLSPEAKTNCTTVLLIGAKYNYFLDYGTLRKDSVYDALTKKGAGSTEILSNALAIGRTVKFKTIVLKNYPDVKKYTVQNSIGSSKYNYVDENIDINWTLDNEEKEIEGYKCQKAFCDFRGRNYIAWYAPAIPISEGPYVFSGLPGLIMELYDSKQHYHFRIAGFEQIKNYDPVYILTDKVTNLSREQIRKLLANSNADPAGVLKNMGGTVQGISEESLAKLSAKPYNPIELE